MAEVNPATEALLMDSKQKFSSAKAQYFKEKKQAKNDYQNYLNEGMIDSDTSFSVWSQGNAPVFIVARDQLHQAGAQVTAAAARMYGQKDIWNHLDKKEYFLLDENVVGREHMEGLLL